MINNKSYIIASLAQSFDDYHTTNHQIHLLGSIFYTHNEVHIKNLVGKNIPNTYVIFRLLSLNKPEGEDLISYYKHSDKVHEYVLNINDFLGLILENDKYVQNFENSVINLLIEEKESANNFSFKNAIFIFEGISWFTLQLLFKYSGVILSSGSVNKRHILSTTQFNLSKFLFYLDYNYNDLYNSSNTLNKILSEKRQNNITMFSYILDKSLMSGFIEKELFKEENKINNSILSLKQRIKEIENNNKSLENDLSIKKGKILKSNKSLENSQKILRIRKIIENNTNFISKLEKYISSLNSNLLDVKNKIDSLKDLNYIDLKKLYLNKYHNLNLGRYSLKLKKSLSDISNLSSNSVNLFNKRGKNQGKKKKNRSFYRYE